MTAISIPPASHPFLGTSMGPNGWSGARRARSAAGHLPPRPTRGRSAPASAGRSRMLGGNGPARLADHGRLAKRGRASMDGTDSDQGALLTAPIGHMPAYGFAHVTALVAIVALSVAAVAWARRADPGRVGRILRAAGWALLLNSIFWTAWGFMPWAWNLQESLPLHFSDALRFLLPIALITRAEERRVGEGDRDWWRGLLRRSDEGG